MRKCSKPIRKYLRQVRVLLPCSFKEKQAILSMLMETLHEYSIVNPSANYEDISEHFGSPEEIICAYLHQLDSSTLPQKLNTKKASCISIIAAVTLLLVLCISFVTKNHVKSTDPKGAPIHINKTQKQVVEIEKINQHIQAYKSALEQTGSNE